MPLIYSLFIFNKYFLCFKKSSPYKDDEDTFLFYLLNFLEISFSHLDL